MWHYFLGNKVLFLPEQTQWPQLKVGLKQAENQLALACQDCGVVVFFKGVKLCFVRGYLCQVLAHIKRQDGVAPAVQDADPWRVLTGNQFPDEFPVVDLTWHDHREEPGLLLDAFFQIIEGRNQDNRIHGFNGGKLQSHAGAEGVAKQPERGGQLFQAKMAGEGFQGADTVLVIILRSHCSFRQAAVGVLDEQIAGGLVLFKFDETQPAQRNAVDAWVHDHKLLRRSVRIAQGRQIVGHLTAFIGDKLEHHVVRSLFKLGLQAGIVGDRFHTAGEEGCHRKDKKR